MPKIDDKIFVQQTLSGDKNAFGKLVDRYKGAVYGLAFSRVKDFEDAKDIAQETFIEAYLKLETLREHSKFSNWLYTITANLCITWLRRKGKRTLSLDELDWIEEIPGQKKILPPPLSHWQPKTPEEEFEQKSLRETVLTAIESLPPKCRETVVLYYMDGLNYKDIADFLAVPVSTVRGRLENGRRKLKKEMITMIDETLKREAPKEEFVREVLEINDWFGHYSKDYLEKVAEAKGAKRAFDTRDEILRWLPTAEITRQEIDLKFDLSGQDILRVLEALGLKRGMRVLEVGCGRGRAALMGSRLLGKNGHFLAVDLEDTIRPHYRELMLDNVEIRIGNILNFDFPPDSFDMIIFVESAQYMSVDGKGTGSLDDLCEIFKKVALWSETIGVADYDPIALDLPGFISVYSILLNQDIARASGEPSEIRLYSQSEIKHALISAGYEVTQQVRLESLQHFYHGEVIIQPVIERVKDIPDLRLRDVYGARAEWLAEMAKRFLHIPSAPRHVTVGYRSS